MSLRLTKPTQKDLLQLRRAGLDRRAAFPLALETRPGVVYTVFFDNAAIAAKSISRTVISDAVQAGVARMLDGRVQEIWILGSNGSKYVLGLKESFEPTL